MQPKKNIGWIDLLRILACFLVILSHSCDQFVAAFDSDHAAFLTGSVIGSFTRPCVPLFTMMTGVLLLPVAESMAAFYRKRIGRIAVPLVFWSLALPVLFYIYLNWVNPATANPSIADSHTLGATLRKFYLFVFNFHYDTSPLWYLYMLLGLYLIMPILSSWLREASKRDMQIFLGVWGLSLLLPYVKMLAPALGYAGNYGNQGILGVCDWNEFGTFYYVSGFIGYLVLAHYLVKYPVGWSRRRTLAICVPAFLIGFAVTAFGHVAIQNYFPGQYANLEMIWYFSSFNVLLMTVSPFIIAQKFDIASKPWLSRVASMTFGIYLSHFVFVQIAYDVFDIAALPYAVRILCMAVSTFVVTYLFVRLLSLSKIGRRLVG